MNAIGPAVSGALAGAKCLVLGAGGFIGINLCEGLRHDGAVVHGFGRRSAFPHALTRVRMTVAELADTAALAAALQGVDVVFHLLGGSFPARAEANPAEDLRGNAAASLDLLALCRDFGVRQIVFVSSGGTVYGLPRHMPIREDHPTDPISAYGIHQLLVEKHLGLLTHRHGVQTVVLRVANPFGPYQPPGRGQGLIPTLIERRLTGRPVEIWGDGQVTRDFFHVADLVDAALAAATYGGAERVLNVGSGIGRPVREVVHAIDAMLGLEGAEVVHRPARPVDVPFNVLDIARIRRVLGWAPRIDWHEGLRDAADWIRLEWLAQAPGAAPSAPVLAGRAR
jgi:UDP-glucose 4-epimerase